MTPPVRSASRAQAGVPRVGHGRPRETEYRPRHPLDLRRTVVFQRHGVNDPTMRVDGAVIWRASCTPEGVAIASSKALKAIAKILKIDGDAACAAKRYDVCEEKYSLALSTEFGSPELESKYTKLLKIKRKKIYERFHDTFESLYQK